MYIYICTQEYINIYILISSCNQTKRLCLLETIWQLIIIIILQVPSIPAGLPAALEQMLGRCFSFDPENRPTFKEMYSVFRSDWVC